jgi:hypothetical protein
MKRLLSVFVILILMVVSLDAQVFQQVPNAGTVNWQDQLITSTGIGAPNPKMPLAAQRAGALEAAKLMALRNLLQTVKGMSLTSETTVENAMVQSDVIQTRVEGIVRNFRVINQRYMSDGSVEVDVEIPLSGILLDALLPAMGTPMAPGQGYPGYQAIPANVVYTGLIIDARGIGVRPAMAPKILDEQGNEVYGTGYVSREFAVQQGVVGYEKDINRAKTNERVTANPVIVKGIKASGTNKSDVVISSNEAQQILNAAKNQSFMEQCRVMIILD